VSPEEYQKVLEGYAEGELSHAIHTLNSKKFVTGIQKYPSGRFGFVGSIPNELAFKNKKTGAPATPEEIEKGKRFGPGHAGLSPQTWASEEEAVAALTDVMGTGYEYQRADLSMGLTGMTADEAGEYADMFGSDAPGGEEIEEDEYDDRRAELGLDRDPEQKPLDHEYMQQILDKDVNAPYTPELDEDINLSPTPTGVRVTLETSDNVFKDVRNNETSPLFSKDITVGQLIKNLAGRPALQKFLAGRAPESTLANQKLGDIAKNGIIELRVTADNIELQKRSESMGMQEEEYTSMQEKLIGVGSELMREAFRESASASPILGEVYREAGLESKLQEAREVKVISYDTWGNAREGFDVNQESQIGTDTLADTSDENLYDLALSYWNDETRYPASEDSHEIGQLRVDNDQMGRAEVFIGPMPVGRIEYSQGMEESAGNPAEIDEGVRHYLIAALWSSTGEDGNPLDDTYEPDDFDPESLERAKKDYQAFISKAQSILPEGYDESQVAHDFWLTRNGHGAGFWDREEIYGEQEAKSLTELAHQFGEQDVYENDAGTVSLSGGRDIQEDLDDPDNEEQADDYESSIEPDYHNDVFWDQQKGDVSYSGKFYGRAQSEEEVFELLEGEFGNMYPDVWMVSDHGNVHLWTDFWEEYEAWKEANVAEPELEEAAGDIKGQVAGNLGPEYELVTDSQEIAQTLSDIGNEDDWGCLFVKVGDGDYDEVYGCEESVPRNTSRVYDLLGTGDLHRKTMAQKFPGHYGKGQVPPDSFGRGGEPGLEEATGSEPVKGSSEKAWEDGKGNYIEVEVSPDDRFSLHVVYGGGWKSDYPVMTMNGLNWDRPEAVPGYIKQAAQKVYLKYRGHQEPIEEAREHRYSLADLKAAETLGSAQYDNLKFDDGQTRVWLSRMTRADGAPYNNQVTVEKLQGGKWVTTDEYQAR